MAVEVIQSDVLRTVAHGFLGRKGGVSTGIYAGLNVGLGSEDARESVIQNRLLGVQSVLPGATLARVHQFHSAGVVQVDNTISQDNPPRGDAMVTNQPNLLLGIVTADCVPVLFADTDAGVIGAAHAGWKGAISGVLENTIAAMEALGATRANIAAVLGPTIAQASYEVDAPFRAHFAPDAARFFAAAPDREGAPRWQFDLPGFIMARLAAAGLSKIADVGRDTFSHVARYHSHRRATKAGEANYGRQISMIALP